MTKQAIIVLREELEYFSITKPGALAKVDEHGFANDELRALKRAAGEALASKRHIFTALQRNVNKENNQAEQHLIDMLCMSGFNRDDEWGYRACEPARNVISSMALVLLKTGIIHPGQPGAPADITTPIIDDKQMGTAQKLLLFWRKPAVSDQELSMLTSAQVLVGWCRGRCSRFRGIDIDHVCQGLGSARMDSRVVSCEREA